MLWRSGLDQPIICIKHSSLLSMFTGAEVHLQPHPSMMSELNQAFSRTSFCCFFSVGKLIDAVAWTHWGCCVCTGDRCAVAAARGQHNLYGTREDMAAPADTEATAKTQDTPTVCIKSLLYNMKSKSVSAGVLANLVIVKRLQADCTVIRLYRLGRVTPQFGLTIHFGLQGRHSLQNILFRKQLKNRAQQNMLFTWLQLSFFMSACGHIS